MGGDGRPSSRAADPGLRAGHRAVAEDRRRLPGSGSSIVHLRHRGPVADAGHARLPLLGAARLPQAVRAHPLEASLMHASIWKFSGDPDELLRSYDDVVAEIPSAAMRLHVCLRAPDGILLVDTCPTEERVKA